MASVTTQMPVLTLLPHNLNVGDVGYRSVKNKFFDGCSHSLSSAYELLYC